MLSNVVFRMYVGEKQSRFCNYIFIRFILFVFIPVLTKHINFTVRTPLVIII